ncbi:Mannan-binding lectin serine protease 1 [Coemansia javaensis]|uniref:Mannan-binding lectin serine protease 1 n=1 Tax=Coemansia javaensis TaxID=2761396 RepID=A0A9W8H574_9FUNG|nr:Mannan-binding lectin serine protease 1 [Coemansia javaensis]
MKILSLAAGALVASAGAMPPHPVGDMRVTNGTAVPQGGAPFLVRLALVSGNEEGLCGGTIIDSTTIVTAGHCVYVPEDGSVRKPSDVYVFYGSVSASSTDYVQATKVVLHPHYDSRTFRNDIAVLRVPELKLSKGYVEPISVYDGKIPPRQAMRVFGWGTTRSYGTSADLPSTLLSQTVYVSEPKACQVIEARYNSADGMQICADSNYNVGVDVCQGDSGTGTTINYKGTQYFAGLVSYGTNRYGDATCGERDSFGIYTHINYFLPWIKSLGASYTTGPQLPVSTVEPPTASSTASSVPTPTPTQTCYFGFICF